MTYHMIVDLVKKKYENADASSVEGHVSVEFDMHGEGEGAFYVEISNGKVDVQPFEYYDRDAKVILSSDAMALIIENDLTFEDAYNKDIIRVWGNLHALHTLDQVRAKKAAKKAPAKKTAAKKPAAEKPAAKKATTGKAPAKKTAAKKTEE